MRRLATIKILAIISSIILLGFIYNMQFNSYDKYQQMSLKNRIVTKPITAQRGVIFDKNMQILAENQMILNVYLTPKNCPDINSALNFIASFTEISKTSRKRFLKSIKHHHKFEQVVVKEDISPSEAAMIFSHEPAMPCVSVDSSLRRLYHMTPAMTNVIGYTTGSESENKGKLGIESTYDNILQGMPGEYKYEVNSSRRPVRLIDKKKPNKGYDIQLTINGKFQEFIYNAFGEENGAAVAINPENGEILAMVSHPSYDSNIFSHAISNEIYKELVGDKNLPMLDRPAKGQFAPGSTIKPFIALSALEADYIRPDFSVIDNLGYFIAPRTNHKYRDWLRTNGGHGEVDIEQSLAYSCDVFYYKLSMLVGMKKMLPWLTGLGFGKNLTDDIPYAAKGVLSSPKWKKQHTGKNWYTGDTIMSYIGQGYMLTTPLQLATSLTVMTNRGILIKPHLLKAIIAKKIPIQHQPKKTRLLNISKASLKKITRGMERVIFEKSGWTTGWRFGIPQYSIAAKTGTAQVVHDSRKTRQNSWKKELRDNSWFMSFSPSDKPKIVLVVKIEHSHTASNIARKIMDYAYKQQIIKF